MGKGVAAGALNTVGTALEGASGQNTAMLQGRIDATRRRLQIMDMVDRGEDAPPDAVGDELGTYEAYKALPLAQRKEFRESQQHLIDLAIKANRRQGAEADRDRNSRSTRRASRCKIERPSSSRRPTTTKTVDPVDLRRAWLDPAVRRRRARWTAPARASAVAAGSDASAGEVIDTAIKNGATTATDHRGDPARAVPTGLSDQMPIETLFERIPLPLAGKFAGVVGKVLAQAAVEGGQEGLQQAAQNLIAKYVYKPDQDITEGVLESAGIGAHRRRRPERRRARRRQSARRTGGPRPSAQPPAGRAAAQAARSPPPAPPPAAGLHRRRTQCGSARPWCCRRSAGGGEGGGFASRRS